jgi:hypothetical protein
MESIQLLDPGTAIRLVGDVPAAVEANPRDGAWLVARAAIGSERLRAADRESEHGFTYLRNPESIDALVVVHADDILGIRP